MVFCVGSLECLSCLLDKIYGVLPAVECRVGLASPVRGKPSPSWRAVKRGWAVVRPARLNRPFRLCGVGWSAPIGTASLVQARGVAAATRSRLLVRAWSGMRPLARSPLVGRGGSGVPSAEIALGRGLCAYAAEAEARAGNTMCGLNICRATAQYLNWGAMQGTFSALSRIY